MRRYISLLLLPVVVGLILLYTLPVRAGKMGGSPTERVSVATDGTQGDNHSYYPAPLLSNDGRYVGFNSQASNFAPTDDFTTHGFLRDRSTDTTTWVTVRSHNAQTYGSVGMESISADNRWMLYVELSDVYLRELETGEETQISRGLNGEETNGGNGYAAMTPDTNFIVYESSATNLVPTDTNGFYSDIFLYNRTTEQTTLVSTNQAGEQFPNRYMHRAAISADGTWVIFSSTPYLFGISGDIYAKNVLTGELRQIAAGSINSDTLENSDISDDGRYIVLSSRLPNLDPTNPTPPLFIFQIYLHDLTTGTTTLISRELDGTPGNSSSVNPVLSADGRYVAFESSATNLTPNETDTQSDIYVLDRETGLIEKISLGYDGESPNSSSSAPSISADGRFVAFNSVATNLVMDDTNDRFDVFVYERTLPPTPTPTATVTPSPTVLPSPTVMPPAPQLYLPFIQRR